MLKNIPSSVYRLQFGETFTLNDALGILPYLEDLGIEGLYCSPLFEAATPNGYDLVNPTSINRKIGTEEDFNALCAALQRKQMQLILDVVPNHMGIKGGGNQWWLDVLKKGPHSEFADFFDIDWQPLKPELQNKVLLPILAAPYGQTLLNQEITLECKDGKFWIRYAEYVLPIAEESYSFILERGSDLNLFNGKKGDAKSFDLLHALLELQYYRLAYWLVAGQEINYRRFFNINELIAIHIEKEHVLNRHHDLVFRWLKEGKIQGLRIDHPDGLYDPAQYFNRLQAHHPSLIIVEKILDLQERLPSNWKVSGTVGYEFLNYLNGLFIQKKNEHKIDQIYADFIGYKIDFSELLYERKKRFILLHMGSEVNSLGWKLDRLSEKNRYYRDFTYAELTKAIGEIIACFPIYRTYIQLNQLISQRDRECIQSVVELAKTKTPEIAPALYDYIRTICLCETEEPSDFILRLQQHTAPVMAKGLEDSLFYIFNRLLSLNEVGGDPHTFGITPAVFHQFNQEKKLHWSLGFLPSSTQDAKRSEDVRMCLNVLSELPDEWGFLVQKWAEGNQRYKKKVNGVLSPDRNAEYHLYQILLGIWPEDRKDLASLEWLDRMRSAFLKSLREAGIHTSWHMQNKEFEEASLQFLCSIVSDPSFYLSFDQFHCKVSRYGRWNSLAALILRLGGCGIVDCYQGTETWNYSLMDPDNRRPVDYIFLKTALMEQGDIKMVLLQKVLKFRKKYKELFLCGDYIPLSTRNEHVIAYMRRQGKEVVVVAVARFFTQLVDPPLGKACWGAEQLELPIEVQGFKDILTGLSIHGCKDKLSLASIFEHYPFAMLTNCEITESLSD